MNRRISYLISALGIKKSDFAKRLNLSQPFVCQMCSGRSKPSTRTQLDICREFGVDPNWLRTGEGEPFFPASRDDRVTEVLSKAIDGPFTARDRVIRAVALLPDDAFPLIEEFILSLSESIHA